MRTSIPFWIHFKLLETLLAAESILISFVLGKQRVVLSTQALAAYRICNVWRRILLLVAFRFTHVIALRIFVKSVFALAAAKMVCRAFVFHNSVCRLLVKFFLANRVNINHKNKV